MTIRSIAAAALAGFALSACVTVEDNAVMADGEAMADSGFARMLAGESNLQGAALDAAIEKAEAFPLGSKDNPVRVHMPQGQRAYLSRLRCPAGDAPAYFRYGSLGPGVFGNIIDGYEVTCADGRKTNVIMDMYHSGHVENRAVPGFTIVGR